MNSYITIKYQELKWAKENNKPTLVKVLTERINEFRGQQLNLF